MVIIEGSFIAKMGAQRLASTLDTWIKEGIDGFFELTYASDDEVMKRTVYVRPVRGAVVITLINQVKYVLCETTEGEQIGFLVPRFEALRSHDVIVLTVP